MNKTKSMRKCYACGTDTPDCNTFKNWTSRGATVSMCFACLGVVSNKSHMFINLEVGNSSMNITIDQEDSELAELTIKWLSDKLRSFVKEGS